MPDHTQRDGSAWSTRAKWAFAVFAIIGGYFLFAEHRAHVLPYVPWLILLACPLMHFFMHGGHDGHGGHHGSDDGPYYGSKGSAGTNAKGSRDGDAGSNDKSHAGGRP